MVIGRAAGGESAAFHIRGAIGNTDGVTRLIGTPRVTRFQEVSSMWNATVAADDLNDALTIVVTGAAQTPIRWAATVHTVEVSY